MTGLSSPSANSGPPRGSEPRAVVLLSGGLDSSTCLASARAMGYATYAMSFDYGQRNRAELDAARAIAADMGVAAHRIVALNLGDTGGSALTDPSVGVPKGRDLPPAGAGGPGGGEVPATYVPARNFTFLAIALGWAEVLDARAIFIGVNAVDYSGYPDCRPAFLRGFEDVAQLATRAGMDHTDGPYFRLMTPLVTLTKAQIVQYGTALGVDFGKTHSCYDPLDTIGKPCQQCDACLLRARGFAGAGLTDPLLARFALAG